MFGLKVQKYFMVKEEGWRLILIKNLQNIHYQVCVFDCILLKIKIPEIIQFFSSFPRNGFGSFFVPSHQAALPLRSDSGKYHHSSWPFAPSISNSDWELVRTQNYLHKRLKPIHVLYMSSLFSLSPRSLVVATSQINPALVFLHQKSCKWGL